MPPHAPVGIAIDGHALPSSELLARRGKHLTMKWLAGSAEDLLYIDVDPIPGGTRDRIRCSLADTGVGQIPAMAIPESSEMNIAIHRVRDVSLRDESGAVGMAHFDLSVSTRVRVAGP
jgi:hypothetical protein